MAVLVHYEFFFLISVFIFLNHFLDCFFFFLIYFWISFIYFYFLFIKLTFIYLFILFYFQLWHQWATILMTSCEKHASKQSLSFLKKLLNCKEKITHM